jgi:hypothetical protein
VIRTAARVNFNSKRVSIRVSRQLPAKKATTT